MYEELVRIAEKIGRDLHAEWPDPQEDSSDLAGERIAEAIRNISPKWTAKTPTKPGWYWAKTDSGIYMFNLQKSTTGGLYFESVGMWWEAAMEEYKVTHWLGPLPEPEFEER